MIRIKLPGGEWEYDPDILLGPKGGFGAVFAGRGAHYDTVAIKKLHLSASDAAHRELRIAQELTGRPLKYVMPFLDAGQDAESDSYFIVMPRAEKSLQQELDHVGKFSEVEAVQILSNIALGLAEVPDLVHRDLKPGNVLYHDKIWKIADFGIARFVEESTSLRTLKDCLSVPYAAPEQWDFEHATHATDIYALGCITHALLTGVPPFSGPNYKEQHLYSDPTSLEKNHPILRVLAAMMLRKPPKVRPSVDRVIQRLNEFSSDNENKVKREGLSALALAGAVDAEFVARSEAAQSANKARQQDRSELANFAYQELKKIVEVLFQTIQREAPTVIRTDATFLEIKLGSARLAILPFTNESSLDAFDSVGWDVAAGAIVCVVQKDPNHYEWSANLWYTDLGGEQGHRWWQIMYCEPWGKHDDFQPFALTNPQKAAIAVSPVMSGIEFAAKPCPVDDEDIDTFCDFWANLLAQAYRGQLKPPTHLPINRA